MYVMRDAAVDAVYKRYSSKTCEIFYNMNQVYIYALMVASREETRYSDGDNVRGEKRNWISSLHSMYS